MSGKFALVIGNSCYDDPALSQLTMPGRDADKLAEVLRSPDIGAFDQVQELIDQPESILRRAIARFFAGRRRDDLLLLYFSGHGVLDDQGLLYFAARDTEHQALSSTAIPASFIRQEMDHSYSRRQVLVLDCCHSGAFGRGAKGVWGANVGTATRFEVEGYGRVVLTASDSTQYAWEGDQVAGQAESSLFTHFLVEGLRTGEADQDGDGQIEADEWYDYAYRLVLDASPKQKPQKFADRVEGPLIIARSPRRASRQAGLSPELSRALKDVRPYVRLGAVSELEKLLKSDDAGLALAARIALELLKDDDNPRVSQAATTALASPFGTVVAQPPIARPLPRLSWVFLGIGISLALIVIFGVGFLLAGMIRNMAADRTDLPLPVETKATVPLVTTTAPIVAQTAAPVSPTAASTPPTQTSPPAPSTVPQFIPVHLTDSKGVEMSLVQAGEFLMGSNEADPGAKKDEMPQKRIFLDDYYLDLTEVTNGMYRLCVDAGACQSPGEVKSSSHEAYYGNPEYDDFPVVYVDWEAARRYCEWRGARLPTEAEWEKAARGTDARTYPWGEGVDCNWANVEGCVADTVKVGSYKTKASPYGMQDMAGNVWEWVGDWYQDTSYQLIANENPTGPPSGKNRVMRGGSCSSTWENSRAANRSWRPPSDQNSFIGFRCARSP